MACQEIYVAHSRGKWGFTCFSHERYPSERYGIQRSGRHMVSDETLDAAMRKLREHIAYDWSGLEMPPIVDCGKVADITGRSHTYAPKKGVAP